MAGRSLMEALHLQLCRTLVGPLSAVITQLRVRNPSTSPTSYFKMERTPIFVYGTREGNGQRSSSASESARDDTILSLRPFGEVHVRPVQITLALASLWLLVQPATALSGPEDEAQALAEAWLTLIDSGNYHESWDEDNGARAPSGDKEGLESYDGGREATAREDAVSNRPVPDLCGDASRCTGRPARRHSVRDELREQEEGRRDDHANDCAGWHVARLGLLHEVRIRKRRCCW